MPLRIRTLASLAAAFVAAAAILAAQATPAPPQSATAAKPGAGFDLARLDRLDGVINDAIAAKQTPGAVVVVGRGDSVVFRRAYGNRSVQPSVEPMTLDTIFDLASLTKVVATTPAVMALIEDGRIRVTDPVATFIPEFGKYGKDRVTVRDLLTHMSGLRPDVDVADEWKGHDEAIRRATEEVLTQPPGRRFVYSDINYFLLGEIVERVTKQPFAEFVRARIHGPLGMRETMFTPPASLTGRIAPTQTCTELGWPCDGPNQRMLRGVVHDPTARRMGGVAGHAGLFSTAADLTIYARMLLSGGAVGATRVLSPLTVRAHDVTGNATGRAERARLRLGHRFVVLRQSRRTSADRIVRPHGIHRDVALDRSSDARVHRVPVEPCPPGRQGRRDAATRARRNDRGVGADRCAARCVGGRVVWASGV
jgi:CubicO group peptidase (beta-lactamase class C family)